MYFPDPVYEEDLLKQNEARDRKFKNLKDNISSNEVTNLINITKKYPNLPKGLATPIAILGVNPESPAVESIADKYAVKQAEAGKTAWELASTDANGEYLYPEHQDMTVNLLKAVKGDAEIGIWALLAVESFGEKIRMLNRQRKYVADLMYYDKWLQEGYSPEEAQSNLQMYVSNTTVPDIGKDKNMWGELRSYINMWSEANEMAGETAFAAAFKEAIAGNPVNYQREGRKFLFESILAEDDARYHRLVDMGYSEKEARKIFYDNIGTPIKANEALGIQEYTSLNDPNKIMFYEGRSSNYAGPGKNINDWFSVSNWWRNKRGLDTGVLQPYSPGRAITYNVIPSGTTAANVMSGIIDAGAMLGADLPLAKGIGALGKLGRAATTVDKLLDTRNATKVDNYLNMFNKNIDELGDSVDPFVDKPVKISGRNGQLIRTLSPEDKADFRAGRKLYKQAGVISGTRKSLFKNTSRDLMNSPFGRNVTRALTEEENVAKIMTTPGLDQLDYTVAKQIADSKSYLEVRDILDNLFDTGVITQMPGKQSGLTNAVLRQSALTGQELSQSQNIVKRTAGRALSAIGKEDAAFRSIGGYLGSGVKGAINVLRKEPVATDSFAELMGFSATLRSGLKPYWNKTLSVTPEVGLSFTNRHNAVKNLISHMQATGYKFDEMKPIVDELIDIEDGNFEEIQRFAYQQILRDEARAKASGKRLPATMIAKKIFETNADIRKYFVDSLTGDNMPFVGDVVETIIERGPNGEKVEMLVPSLHLLAEGSELYAPLMDYRLINRAMGKVFTTYGDEFESGLRANLRHTKQNAVQLLKGDTNFKGLIPSKGLTDDAYTLTLDYMTRNLFKPLVLLRGAWFVRVFLEESLRMAAAGVDSMFTHPADYMIWARSHGHNVNIKGKDIISAGGVDSGKLRESLEFAEVTNSNWTAGALRGRPTKAGKMGRDYVALRKGEENYIQGIAFELMQLRNDPIARYLAENGFNDASKAWFRSKAALPLRQDLARLGGKKMQGLLTNTNDMDAYLASVEARIRMKTGELLQEGVNYVAGDKYSYKFGAYGGDARLREAIWTGKLETPSGTKIGFINDVTKEYGKDHLAKIYKGLSSFVDEGVEFGLVKYHKPQPPITGFLGRIENRLDIMVDTAFKHLMTKPNAYLSRSVVFKQYRWQWISDNFGSMSDDLQVRFIKEAQEAKIPKKLIEELQGQKGITAVRKIDDYDLANVQSKAYGLSATKQLLYDASKKHLISDITRNIFPFPEVWFELAQTWSKLLINNPYRARQAQLAVTGARGSDAVGYTGEGFFAPDPSGSGSEMFVYPGSDFLTNSIFGEQSDVRVAPKGFVQGINLLGQGFIPAPLPYVGVLADKVLPRHGLGNEVRGLLYGEFGPPSAKDIIPLPAWLQKITAAIGVGDEASQLRASTTIDVYKYGKAVGRDKALAEQGKLDRYLERGLTVDEAYLEYSKLQASKLYLFRGISQFFLPTGWTPRYYIEDKNGKYWGTQQLAKEYTKLIDANDNDNIAAFNEFVSIYGIEHGWLTAPKTQSKVGRQSFTDRVMEFQSENKEVLDAVPLSKYYVLPDSPYDERNYAQMYDAFNKGDIETLDPEQYQRQVNDTLGYFRYTAFKEQVEAMGLTNKEETVLLRVYRNYLINELPGFQRDYGLINPVKAKVVLEEMQNKWLNNDTIMTTESGKAFAEFNPVWEQAAEISAELSPTDNPEWWLTSGDTQAKALRLGVAQIAKSIIEQYPDFKYVWIGVYSRLFRDDTEVMGIFND